MKNSRIQELKKLILREKQVSSTDLSQRLGVSVETVRRDLALLEQEGFVEKHYGGARLVDSHGPSDTISEWDSRLVSNERGKRSMAVAVAQRIPNGCTVYLGSGTTIYEVLPLLKEKRNLTVLTSSLRNALALATYDSFTVYCIGGVVKPETMSTYGFFSKEFLSNFYRIDYMVVSCDGFIPEYGITEFSLGAAEVKQFLHKKADHVIVAVDHTKLGVRGSSISFPTECIDTLVTDRLLPEEDIHLLQDRGVELVVTEG